MKHGIQGEGGGRPPKFKTESIWDIALTEYLNHCISSDKLPNIAGFCSRVGISKDTFSEYGKKYPATKKKFMATVEDVWVRRLGETSPTGAIFYLKNAFRDDYKDRHETDITTQGEKISGPSISAEVIALAEAELKKRKTQHG